MRILCLLTLFMLVTCDMCAARKDWKRMQSVVSAIRQTEFPIRHLCVTDYHKKGDALYTDAINTAISMCSNMGGGTVDIPDGTYYSGPITLRSNVNLHLGDHTILKFITDRKAFNTVLTRIEGIDCQNLSPLIYAYNAENIAITGKGILDGQASEDNWFSPAVLDNIKLRDGRIGHEKTLLNEALEYALPIEDRIFAGDEGMRPQFINLYKCRRILIEDVEIVNSPFWLIHPLLSEDVIVRRVRMVSHGRNNDGCNPESCKNVLIEDCFFDTGDDCIANKSGKEGDGRRWNVPSQNIIIRHCRMRDGHAAVAMGSEITGGCHDVWVEDCVMDSPHLMRIIRIKSNPQRGGEVRNIFVRNIEVGECALAILGIEMNYWRVKEGPYLPYFHHILMENIRSKKSRYVLHVDGLRQAARTAHIKLKDCSFFGVAEPEVNYMSGAANISFIDVQVNGKKFEYKKPIN